jgi:hypothetical protein
MAATMLPVVLVPVSVLSIDLGYLKSSIVLDFVGDGLLPRIPNSLVVGESLSRCDLRFRGLISTVRGEWGLLSSGDSASNDVWER